MILKFYAETPVVKGFNRSCIYDLPRQKYDFVPNDVLKKIIELENKDKIFVESQLDEVELSWLDLFIENEYCFYISKDFIDCFPKIDFTWKSPSKVTNAIVDISDLNTDFDFLELENLNCMHIVIRFEKINKIDGIFTFLKTKLNDLTFRSVEIIIVQDISVKIKLYNSLKKRIEQEINIISNVEVLRKKPTKLESRFRPNFIIQISIFSEAQKNNLFFNRKLYIDSSGFIKNGIESDTKFFSLRKKTIEETVDKPAFQKLWKTNKDKIDVCKDCEFRYMCVDNRIPIQREDDSLYFEKECAYNPYISLWDNDENFMSLEQIGIKLDKNGFDFDIVKIKKINEVIWNVD